MTSLPPGIVLIVGAVLLVLLPRRIRSAAVLVLALLTFVVLLRLEPGSSLTVRFLSYELVPLRVDRLSVAFGYVFILISFLGGVYAFHLKDARQQVAALLYAGSSLGVVFSGDLFTLFIFWELMTVSSAILIWARQTAQSRRAGMRYIIVHLFGGSLLMAGILLYSGATGSILFDHFQPGLASYLILGAFAINAAIPPLHAWLSDAYPEGTVTGSVFLSAFTTKVAVYALARGFAGFDLLIWAGIIMAVYGVVFAVLENDIRRLLAYHIISQVGYMVAAVGIGTQMAINGATAHAFAHILYKGLLFMGAGTVLYATGLSKLTELGGLARAMPLALSLYMIGAFSISGFPLFSGFVSKSMVVSAAELSHLGMAVLLLNLAAVGTFLHTGLKLPYFTWFGPQRSLEPTPVPRGMYVGMGLTAASCVAIGVFPNLLYNLLPFPVSYQPYSAPHVLQTLQLLMFTGLGFWLLIAKLGGEATITLDTDWFYRKPARLAYQLCVVTLSQLFSRAEVLSLNVVGSLVRFSTNPVAYLHQFAVGLACRLSGKEPKHVPLSLSQDRYRLRIEVMLLVVFLSFIGLMLLRFILDG